jgi:hypothetical protein
LEALPKVDLNDKSEYDVFKEFQSNILAAMEDIVVPVDVEEWIDTLNGSTLPATRTLLLTPPKPTRPDFI